MLRRRRRSMRSGERLIWYSSLAMMHSGVRANVLTVCVDEHAQVALDRPSISLTRPAWSGTIDESDAIRYPCNFWRGIFGFSEEFGLLILGHHWASAVYLSVLLYHYLTHL